ncbi:MAG TPA: phage terminase large subunit [Puia sp.]|jgi:phage terminase large subunit|nr:phage terminase large subunit [Puia sp.]
MIEVEIHKDVYLECFHHLLEPNDIDIEILWGGRDSGKSKFIAQILTEDCMGADYFRCILIKQTHESIKDAQWQMIKDNAEQWGVDPLFRFKTSPLGIECRSGGTFATRGLDDPGKLRSFTNPSKVWVEEANQTTEEGFITIITGLRSDYGKIKVWLSLNPEALTADYKEFWLYKMFFAAYEGQLNFTGAMVINDPKTGQPMKDKEGNPVQVTYRATHVTYVDNPYVSPQRIAFHESLKNTNYYWYQVYTLGLWGNQANDAPWAFAFDRSKHVGHCQLNPKEPVYLSFDFNRNPMCCAVIQHYGGRIYVLQVFKIPKSGVDAVCAHVLVFYPGCLYIVTGDYSGNNETSLFAEQVTHYKLIQQYLRLSPGQLKVKPNPRLQKNQTHVNCVLAFYKVTIDEEKAAPLIFDMQNVKKRADGTIVKEDRNDPAQQSDALDTFRYFCNNFMDWFRPMDKK